MIKISDKPVPDVINDECDQKFYTEIPQSGKTELRERNLLRDFLHDLSRNVICQ